MSEKNKGTHKLYSYALALIADNPKDSRAHSGFVTSKSEEGAGKLATEHGRVLYGDSDTFVMMHVAVNELKHTLEDVNWNDVVLFDD